VVLVQTGGSSTRFALLNGLSNQIPGVFNIVFGSTEQSRSALDTLQLDPAWLLEIYGGRPERVLTLAAGGSTN
jgi:hypothetical protein